MNHLAHLFLAQPTTESRVGNLLGDFAKGVRTEQMAPDIQRGLANHRAVDAYTDQHPEVAESRALFSSQRRRFSGIALDVLYDHFLIRHWATFATLPLDTFIGLVYRDLDKGKPLMPEHMAQVVSRIIGHDWFTAYGDFYNIGGALDRVAERIRFRNAFGGVIEELEPLHDDLEARFLRFFPDLIRHVQARNIELAHDKPRDETPYWIRYNRDSEL